MSVTKEEKSIAIKAPDFRVLEVNIRGVAPYVQHRFYKKGDIIAAQQAGSQNKSKKVHKARDFDSDYQQSMHKSREGWVGIPAGSFRNAMISACRTVGYKMTHAKLAASVVADGFDAEDGTPLVRLYGEPRQHFAHARNDNGSVDIRCRPMWEEWNALVRIRFDQGMFSATDIINLMMRVGMQVGIGEGRPDSRDSAGLGWGLFEIVQEEA